ncbi:MAG TPA: bifunctional 3-demethylubiquinol 3-O-methyltransferase/2-polyprenyl-6-hydroxyphenol methylase, partial [Gammaproteobacteria bacterium]|nr:bifunctional 3-demethylubiquinol 3-O-methyltransferase/2-polyprenyl-6-hydroxyphenol methylase [Gammaproteobacteria bacterium]
MYTENVEPAEVEKFAAQAAEWWDPRGPFKTLHEINP